MTNDECFMAQKYVRQILETEEYPGKASELEMYLADAFIAGRDSLRAEYSRDIGSEAYDDTVDALETERERSQKLLIELKAIDVAQIVNGFIEQKLISTRIANVIAEYEESCEHRNS